MKCLGKPEVCDAWKQKTGTRTSLFHLSEVKVEEIKCRNDWSDA